MAPFGTTSRRIGVQSFQRLVSRSGYHPFVQPETCFPSTVKLFSRELVGSFASCVVFN